MGPQISVSYCLALDMATNMSLRSSSYLVGFAMPVSLVLHDLQIFEYPANSPMVLEHLIPVWSENENMDLSRSETGIALVSTNGMMTAGNSSPFDLCMVITMTASAPDTISTG